MRSACEQRILPRFFELEAKYGSLTRGVLAERAKTARNGRGAPGSGETLFRTLKGGLSQLIRKLQTLAAPNLRVIHATVEAIEESGFGRRVRVNGDWVEASHIILACPDTRPRP